MTQPHGEQGRAGVRAWMACQYLAVVAWVAGIAALVIASAQVPDFVKLGLLLVSMTGTAFLMGFLFSPARAWWAPEVGLLMADPAQRRRYRVRMTLALVFALVVVMPLVVIAVGGLGTVDATVLAAATTS